MIDFLYSIDTTIFYFINHTLSNRLFDRFFPFITEVKHWYIAYIILWCIAFFKGGRLGKIAAIGALLLITVSDQISSAVLKDLFGRARPCITLPDVHILAGCTGSGSFPSSHAVNNFAIAIFFTMLYPKLKGILFTVATLVALSRPYCGVHYPSDIVGGALIGLAIGYIFGYLALKTNAYFEAKKAEAKEV
jgi:undecaprenyl-diphosphatase